MRNTPFRSTRAKRTARLSVPTRAEKIPFHRQGADLRVQVPDRGLLLRLPRPLAVGENFVQPVDRLPLPRAHLVRMDLVSGRDLLHRAVSPQRLEHNPLLERRRERRRSLVVIPVPPHQGSGIHRSRLSEKAGPPHTSRSRNDRRLRESDTRHAIPTLRRQTLEIADEQQPENTAQAADSDGPSAPRRTPRTTLHERVEPGRLQDPVSLWSLRPRVGPAPVSSDRCYVPGIPARSGRIVSRCCRTVAERVKAIDSSPAPTPRCCGGRGIVRPTASVCARRRQGASRRSAPASRGSRP